MRLPACTPYWQVDVNVTADLASYHVLGGICQGHVDMKWCPGVDFSAGSLGMGLSFGMGSAIAGRLEGSERQVYVMLGDGEIKEVFGSGHGRNTPRTGQPQRYFGPKPNPKR